MITLSSFHYFKHQYFFLANTFNREGDGVEVVIGDNRGLNFKLSFKLFSIQMNKKYLILGEIWD